MNNNTSLLTVHRIRHFNTPVFPSPSAGGIPIVIIVSLFLPYTNHANLPETLINTVSDSNSYWAFVVLPSRRSILLRIRSLINSCSFLSKLFTKSFALVSGSERIPTLRRKIRTQMCTWPDVRSGQDPVDHQPIAIGKILRPRPRCAP